MPTELENQHEQQYNALHTIILVARREKYWIFDTISKEWFSPDELEARYITVPNERGWFQRFKVLNPIDGLKAADITLQKILSKKQELENRVIKYYQQLPK